ncbi:MAG TPA: ATP-binding protein [Acidimicrobiales bacterium]
MQLVGRVRERELLDRLLATALSGRGGSLVLLGEPGIGKTALLDYAAQAGEEFQVVRTAGIEGEMDFPYSGLHRLCKPSLAFLEHLPLPQREALAVSLGLSVGQAPELFLVALAVLGLLSEAANEWPVLCIIDDAQWLDRESARALAFIARRLLAERIALVFAMREPGNLLAGLPELHLGPWVIVTPEPSWSRPYRLASMTPSWRGSWLRRVGTRSRCWNCRRA